MNYLEEYLFWLTANYFIVKKEYRIVQLSKDQNELWLERLDYKQAPIIRLLKYNLDWSNWMQRDIERTAENGERVRKQLNKRDMNIVNIYFSPYPPVDDYAFRLEKPFIHPISKKTNVTSFIVDRTHYEKTIETIGELFFQESLSVKIEHEPTEQEIDVYKHAALTTAVTKVKSEQAVFENGKPFFTYIFIAVQIIMFLFLEMMGGSQNTQTLIKYGAKFNPLIIEGDWWRFITPIFLHIGFLHLLMNTLALYYLGTVVERIYGNVRFLIIYLFAGFSGSLASFAFIPNLSAGASGAIFGCFGALLYFGLMNRKLFFRTMGMNVIVVLVINLALGFSLSGVDNAGHIGGLIGGFLATVIVQFPKKKKLMHQLLAFLISVLLVGSLLKYGYSESTRAIDDQSVFVLASKYLQDKEYQKAYSVLHEFSNNEQSLSVQYLLMLSFSELKIGKNEEAKKHLLSVIKKEPNNDEAHYYLAFAYLHTDDVNNAKLHADKALALKPNQKEYMELQKSLLNKH